MLFIAAGLGLRRICISFAISIKIASVLAGAHGIIEWLVCITPWCWCYQFLTSTRTKIRPASLKNKGSDKLTTCIHILIHHSFYNWGNGTADDLHEVISYDLIPERFLKDTWRTVEGQILVKQMIKKIKYSQQFLFMALPLVISTSPGKRLKHLRGRKTAIQGKDSAAFNAVNSPLPLVCKLSLSQVFNLPLPSPSCQPPPPLLLFPQVDVLFLAPSLLNPATFFPFPAPARSLSSGCSCIFSPGDPRVSQNCWCFFSCFALLLVAGTSVQPTLRSSCNEEENHHMVTCKTVAYSDRAFKQ